MLRIDSLSVGMRPECTGAGSATTTVCASLSGPRAPRSGCSRCRSACSPFRSRCSACADLRVHDGPIRAFTIGRNPQRYGTWAAVADAMGVSINTLWGVSKGKDFGSMKLAELAARAAGVRVEVLISGEVHDVDVCPDCGQPWPR
jgi:hypothetical protein